MPLDIERADLEDAPQVAELVGILLNEISAAVGAPQFDVELERLTRQAREFLASEHYLVWFAREQPNGPAVGVLTLYEAGTLYAGGFFGVVAELFVRPENRGRGTGERLLGAAQRLATERGWTRLEVTTPPLPQFERVLRFYERHGFAVTGGRKMRWMRP